MTDALPWLRNRLDDLLAMAQRGQLPQALLIHGPVGCGRRHLALSTAAYVLHYQRSSIDPVVIAEPDIELGHPDFLGISRMSGKNIIAIDQVRELTGFLQLTSLKGGSRVAVLWPAETMTHSAANSLLKTLEEPPRGATIILVAESPARLPATILSRCHRVRVDIPARTESVAWLRGLDSTVDWALLLDFALDAPLVALALHRCGFGSQATQYAEDIRQLQRRGVAPIVVAKRWANGDIGLVLRWLYGQVARSVRRVFAAMEDPASSERLQNSSNRLNIQPLLRRLREIEEAFRYRDKSLNPELQLAALLAHWYGEKANPN